MQPKNIWWQTPATLLAVMMGLQLLVWTLLPYLLVKGMYVDILENIEWGRHWELGYDKNPYFGAWLTYCIYHLTDRSFLSLYFTSQLAITAAWFASWRLAKRMLPALPALVSTLALPAIGFYSGISVELNDNVINTALWALSCWSFYVAVTEQKYSSWLVTGVLLGCAAMTKYYTLMLLLAMLGFLFRNKAARTSFKKPAFYTGLTIFLIMVVPNLIWLTQHAFITVVYALGRAGMYKSLFYQLLDHLLNPAEFALGIVLFALPIWLSFKACFPKKDNYQLASFDQQSLNYLYFGPLYLSVFFSAVTGARMIFMWDAVLFNLIGIVLVGYYRPLINWQNIRKFLLVVSSLWSLYLISFIYIEALFPYRFKLATQANMFEIFPGQALAATLTQVWQQHFQQPLKYVAGERFYTLNLAAYSSAHPIAYFACDSTKSPWIKPNDLRQYGALFVWKGNEQGPPGCDLKRQYPDAVRLPPINFAWALPTWPQRLLGLKPPLPVSVQVALLSPAEIRQIK